MGELRSFLVEEDGVTVVEIVLVLLVLIALVMIFKDQITSLMRTLMNKVSNQSGKV
jgi:Flp pilus assembly pilin Flp